MAGDATDERRAALLMRVEILEGRLDACESQPSAGLVREALGAAADAAVEAIALRDRLGAGHSLPTPPDALRRLADDGLVRPDLAGRILDLAAVVEERGEPPSAPPRLADAARDLRALSRLLAATA